MAGRLFIILAGLLALLPLVAPSASAYTEATGARPLSAMAERLQQERAAVRRDPAGRAIQVFGIPVEEVRIVLLPVDRSRPLPEGYEPPDLVRMGGRLVRALIRSDLAAMIEAAGAARVDLAVVSGYRSPDEQAMAFESSVWRAVGRSGGTLDRAGAEERASRYVAPPGHSQHQLGTAVDFSTWEISYAVQARFAETAAGRWLEAHAWEYGFVLSYPRDREERTGYAYEAWHYRWVGRELAAVLQTDRYLEHPFLVVDDYLRGVEDLLAFEEIP